MTLKQILTVNVTRIDAKRALMWDVGAALTRPVTNPLVKFVGGWLIGILVCAVGGIMIGSPPSDRAVRLMGVVVGVLFAMMPNRLESHRPTEPEGPAV